MSHRDTTRRLMLGGVPVGGGAPVSVQSMTSTDTRDVEATLAQIRGLRVAGCEIVRVAVPDAAAAAALGQIVAGAGLPVVADIHFDHRLALQALEAGCAGLRLNPGNIGGDERVNAVARAALERGVPIRVGVNAGSLEPALFDASGHATAAAMVASAERQVDLLQSRGMTAVKVSLKASDAVRTLEANRLWAARSDLPLHLGLTEAGTRLTGAVRSAAVLGVLLAEGIGDTIRISLAADPLEEVRVGLELLRTLGLRPGGLRVVACPTCGRCAERFDVAGIAERVEARLNRLAAERPVTVAVMGCAVNGPGEAREADVGVAGGDGMAVLFRRGDKVGPLADDEVEDRLVAEVEALLRVP